MDRPTFDAASFTPVEEWTEIIDALLETTETGKAIRFSVRRQEWKGLQSRLNNMLRRDGIVLTSLAQKTRHTRQRRGDDRPSTFDVLMWAERTVNTENT